VGQVDGQGIEGSLQWAISDNWDLIFAAGWLDTKAYGVQLVCGGADDGTGIPDGNPDGCEGNPLNWAPEFMGSALLKANFPAANGEWVGNLEAFWEGERGGGYEALEWAKLDAQHEIALRMGYVSNNNWSLTGYVENLTDEVNYAGAQVNSGITPDWKVGVNRPRTFGMRVGYYFD
jgi:iron complex outermembrane receptor protein